MPRVLIADDNSNVQKMVALALKDAGIEVVAVGNGEAAVRKMPELVFDLVLADIFMPVRNGYEVCEFVKHDPRYMHTPVVLLVGAFDPLDEREAQRVRADGVLKKPFVPPDPLVNMVTSLLAKAAGERLAAMPPPAAAPVEPPAAVPTKVPVAPVGASVAKETKHAPAVELPEISAEQSEQEFSPAAAPVTFAKEGKPLAFSSLLEAPTASSEDPDPIVTATRDPSLGEPAFWAHPPAADPATGELTEGHAWDEALPRRSTAGMLGPDEPESVAADEEIDEIAVEFDAVADQEPAEEPTVIAQQSVPEPPALVDTTRWAEIPPELTEPEPVEPEHTASAPSSEILESQWRQWAAETTAAPEESEASFAASLIEEQAKEEIKTQARALAKLEKPAEIAVVHEVRHPAEAVVLSEVATAAPVATAPSAVTAAEPVAAVSTQPEQVEAKPVVKAREKEVEFLSVHEDFSAMDEPWEPAEPAFPWARVQFPPAAALQHAVAEQVALAAQHTVAEEVAVTAPSVAPEQVAVVVPHAVAEQAVVVAQDAAAEPASAPEEPSPSEPMSSSEQTSLAAIATTSVVRPQDEHEVASEVPLPAEPVAVAEPAPMEHAVAAPAESRLQDPQFMEAVIERVIERMQPRMVEIVTQEILRPVVEAMVRRELEKS